MKYLFIVLLGMICDGQVVQIISLTEPLKSSPLAAYSSEWNKVEYSSCNTAKDVGYMSDTEKEVIYILNLARTYPKLFANTVLAKYPALSGKGGLVNNQFYYQSLVKTMLTMNQAQLLKADEQCFISAECHARTMGASGEVGHTRKS